MYARMGLNGWLFGVGLAVTSGLAPAQAADIYAPDRPRYSERFERYVPRERVYARPRYLPPVEERVVTDDGDCRVFIKRRLDRYGREVVRRVRVCDEIAARPHRWAGASYGGYEPLYDPPRPPARLLDDDDED